MANAAQTHTPIPAEWRSTVAGILREGSRDAIITTLQSNLDWSATFPEAWDFERFNALASALIAETVLGRHITTMDDPGEVWAFWFTFEARQLYAKINLLPDGQIIIIYSSHIPRKGKESL